VAIDIWGRVIANDSDYNIAEAERAARVRQLTDAHLAQHRTKSAPAASADPVERTDYARAPRSVTAAPSSSPLGDNRSVATSVDPVRVLDAALNAAVDDVVRAALLAAAPRLVREQLVALWGYKSLITDQPDEYEVFGYALDAAANDADRATLIGGRPQAFLVEWAWRTRATSEDWRRRYLAQVGGGDPG